MKITAAQLTQQLQTALLPFYLVHGDEILLVQEAVDTLRKAAQAAGFTERISCRAEASQAWAEHLYSNTHATSLFSEKKIIELNLNAIKFTANNQKILEEYITHPVSHTLVILISSKLDSKMEKSDWYKAIDKHGAIVAIWPIPKEQLPAWIIQRAKKLHLTLTAQGAEFLASQIEGNLLAAAQEIEKLALLQPDGILDEKAIADIVTDHARFDIFALVDNALLGKTSHAVRILKNLCAEDTEPTFILWALTRELRTLAEIKRQSFSQSLGQLFTSFRIWEKRQAAFKAALQRHSLAHLWDLLMEANNIDQMIKGAQSGNLWDAFERWIIKISHKNAIVI